MNAHGQPTPPKGARVRVSGHNGAGQHFALEGEVLGYEFRVDPGIIFVRTDDGKTNECRYGWVKVNDA